MRRSVFIVVSLALHALLFWWLLHNAWRSPVAPRPPLQITLREAVPPKARTEKRTVPLKPKPLPALHTANVQMQKSDETTAPLTETPVAASPFAGNTPTPEPLAHIDPFGHGALLIPWTDHGGHTQHREEKEDAGQELARVQARMAKENEAFQVRLDTQTGARGTVVDLKHGIIDRFQPLAEWVQSIPRSKGARDRKTDNMLEARNRPQANSEFNRAQAPGQRQLQLYDACAASHEIGRLQARIRVVHDKDGQAQSAELVEGSGSEAFDEYAKKVVLEASREKLTMMKGEAVPIFTEWSLAQVVYDWYSTTAMGCPPTLHPPGRPVDPNARDPWGITYTNDITLAAVRYRHH